MRLASAPLPIAFVGSAAFFASPSSDTTFSIISISIPNRGLTFQKNEDQSEEYNSTYEVTISVKQDTTEILRKTRSEAVTVSSLQERRRTDESIVYREVFRLAPGRYTASYTVHDVLGKHVATDTTVLRVPRFDEYSVSKPIIVYEAKSRTDLHKVPSYVASPRAAAEFGVDTALRVYLEAYDEGAGNVPIELSLRDSAETVLWIDTVQIKRTGRIASGVFDVPITSADLGIYTIATRRIGTLSSTIPLKSSVPTIGEGVSTVSPLMTTSPIFIGFGPNLPVTDFKSMLRYLQWFVRGRLVKDLHDVKPENRRQAWSSFLRATDDLRSTLRNERLQEYFARVFEASHRFVGDGPEGWLTDRGAVFILFGDPIEAYEADIPYVLHPPQNDPRTPGYRHPRGAIMPILTWGYPKGFITGYEMIGPVAVKQDLNFVFYDIGRTGQWRLTPTSRPDFEGLLRQMTSFP